jgi:hypothetical protein
MDVLKITVTDENGDTTVSHALHESYYDLARDIAKLPQNHDELHVLIADRIKRYVHQEKLSVYDRINTYFGDSTKDPQMSEFLLSKIETHSKLAKEWKYGTEYSVGSFPLEKK